MTARAQGELPGATRHECPVPECRTRVRAGLMMCGAHWSKVDAETQRKVYEAWNRLRNGVAAAVPEYRTIKAQAIAQAAGGTL